VESISAPAPILDIDHVMCGVGDLDAAARAYERLGFRLTPPSRMEGIGVANRLVLLRPAGPGVANFVELMTIEQPATASDVMRQVLAGPPGVKSVVHAVASAERIREHHVDAGLEMLPVWPVERDWTLESGETLHLAFRVALPRPGRLPLMFNHVEYLTLQHYLRPELREHPNGAVRLSEVTAVGGEQEVEAFERHYGRRAERVDGAAVLTVRDVRLRIAGADALAADLDALGLEPPAPPAYLGFAVEVEDLGRAEALLARGGVRAARLERRVLVHPDDVCGSLLELRGRPA
jgi:catechol 2,3-dioxygenase-like lactoylglutathione lyase family enzyme